MLPFAGILAIVATGQTVVIQQRGLDLSSAGILGLAGIVFALVGIETGSLLIAVGAAIVSGALVGAINGLLVAGIGITPLVATLSVNALVIGGIRGRNLAEPNAISGSFAHSSVDTRSQFSCGGFRAIVFARSRNLADGGSTSAKRANVAAAAAKSPARHRARPSP